MKNIRSTAYIVLCLLIMCRSNAVDSDELKTMLSADSIAPANTGERPHNAAHISFRMDEDSGETYGKAFIVIDKPGVLTWADYFEIVRTYSPDMVAARARAHSAISRIAAATGWKDPKLEADTNPGTWSNDRPAFDLLLKIPVPWYSQLAAAENQATYHALADVIYVANIERHHLVESRDMYGQYWLAARQQERIQRAITQAQDAITSAEAALASATNGNAAKELAEAKLVFIELQRDLLNAQRAQKTAVHLMSEQMGIANPQDVPPPEPKLPAIQTMDELDTEVDDLIDGLPEVLFAKAGLQAAQAGLDYAKLNRRPEWELRLGYDHADEESEERWLIGFETQIPVTSASRLSAREDALHRITAARAEVTRRQAEVVREIHEALNRLQEHIDAFQLIHNHEIPAANDALAYAQAAYAGGQGPLAAVIRAEIRVIEAERKADAEHAEYYRWLGELECCVGRIME